MSIGQTITDLLHAQKQHDEAFRDYGGYSWGYFGYRHIERVRLCQAAVEDEINRIVDERIKTRLEKA